MTTNLFQPDAPSVLQTADGRGFPVARVFCVGRNYEAHAREMGKDPERDPPFYFTKWPETVRNADQIDGLEIPYPSETENYHHEAELVAAIGKPGFRISKDDALDHVCGYAVGLDMTRRDLQLEAREKGRPWDLGKNVSDSCPTGRLHLFQEGASPPIGRISLSVNGEIRQDASTADLIWSVSEIVSHLSNYYALRRGDLIYTGTPAGVGPVDAGDVIECAIEGLSPLTVRIGPAHT
ncbi:MAG: fumarylacetoacetate hydrolase family protein [Pseudomonadota bacterium]